MARRTSHGEVGPMKILLDTNVLLDLLLEREHFVEDAKRVFQAKDEGMIAIYITANSLTDVFYIGRPNQGQGDWRGAGIARSLH